MARLMALRRLATFGQSAARPVSLLATGTLLAQVVPVLLSPVLTRLYSPEAYGALAWAVSIVTVATLLASGTYDQAVNLPQERAVATAIVLGIVFAGVIAGTLLALVSIVEWRWRDLVSPRMWFVPAATTLTVAFNGVAAWGIREARFGELAAGRVTLAIVGVAITLLLGALGWGETGLMLGNLAGLLVGLVVLLIAIAGRSGIEMPIARARDVPPALRTYRRFPLLLLPSSLLNTVTNQLPVWFLQHLFGAGSAGQYALMNRVLSVPVALIGSSAGEVFKQRAAAEYRETGRSQATWTGFFTPLAALGLPMGLIVFATGPWLFALVFGEPWREAGRYAQVLALFFVFRCVVSPLSYMLILAQRQTLDLILQGCCLLGAVLAWVAGAQTNSPAIALGVFGGCYSAVYMVYFFASRRLALGDVSPTQ